MTEHPKKERTAKGGVGGGVLCDCGHPWGQPNVKRIKIKETKRLWSIVLLWPPPPCMGVGSKETEKTLAYCVVVATGQWMDGWGLTT